MGDRPLRCDGIEPNFAAESSSSEDELELSDSGPPADLFNAVGTYPVCPLLSPPLRDDLCAGVGLSDRNLLLGRGLGLLDNVSKPGVIELLWRLLVPLTVVALLLGVEAVTGIVGVLGDSSLDRGKGNSRAGGMGRMFAPPSSAEEEASIAMAMVWAEFHRCQGRELFNSDRPQDSGRTFATR